MDSLVIIPEHTVEVYQLRVWLKRISPMIWRRLLVRSDSTIADLHHTLQITMGWSDYHLNQFIIRGKAYGVYRDGGMLFDDNPREIRLGNFNFRLKEKFLYTYNFRAPWEHEIRFEKRLPLNPKKFYPMCSGGNRLAPSESCDNFLHFLQLQDYYSVCEVGRRLFKLLKQRSFQEKGSKEDALLSSFLGIFDSLDIFDDGEYPLEEESFENLHYWLKMGMPLDRAKMNHALRQYFLHNIKPDLEEE